MSNFKSVILSASKQAAKVLLNYFDRNNAYKIKSDKSLVTNADIRANNIIIRTIKRNFPNHNIVSEETAMQQNKSDYTWVIDPLDGTHNFIHGIPIFGTSIALKYKNDILIGLLHFPILKTTLIAEKGKGAFLNGKRISVSNKTNLNHSYILFEYAYANRKEKVEFLKKLIHKTIDVRNFGSAIYDLALVACGKSDGFVILSTHEWDVIAGFLIVKEAGGRITNLKGNKWTFKENKFVVSNGRIHKELLRYVK